jgi:hypothetical protein
MSSAQENKVIVYEIWRSDIGESVYFVSSGFWRHVNMWVDTSVSLEHTSSVFFVSVQYSTNTSNTA